MNTHAARLIRRFLAKQAPPRLDRYRDMKRLWAASPAKHRAWLRRMMRRFLEEARA